MAWSNGTSLKTAGVGSDWEVCVNSEARVKNKMMAHRVGFINRARDEEIETMKKRKVVSVILNEQGKVMYRGQLTDYLKKMSVPYKDIQDILRVFIAFPDAVLGLNIGNGIKIWIRWEVYDA